jgi:hypothetical protein
MSGPIFEGVSVGQTFSSARSDPSATSRQLTLVELGFETTMLTFRPSDPQTVHSSSISCPVATADPRILKRASRNHIHFKTSNSGTFKGRPGTGSYKARDASPMQGKDLRSKSLPISRAILHLTTRRPKGRLSISQYKLEDVAVYPGHRSVNSHSMPA